MTERRKMLGEILVEIEAATLAQIQEALQAQAGGTEKKKLGEVLVERGVCSPEDISRALARQFGLDEVDLDGIDISPDVIAMVDKSIARQHRVVPIKFSEGVLTLAVPDPLDLYSLDELRFVLNCNVEVVLAMHGSVEKAIAKYYGSEEK